RAFPNLTVIDTGNILRQIQTMLDQVVRAVQFLFVLTLTAGVIVLYGALASTRDERIRESALMRALGASRRQLATAQLWELAFTGALAGSLAGLGALAIGWELAAQVFDFTMTIRWATVPAAALAGAVLTLVAGYFEFRGVVSTPPGATLREL
ncbi:MAG: FtsX-like permease family protein, partial [Burkholderiaceae bacterium]|nr:FtsX-like permease family protein [Burkholderiaceae bacterium]